MLFILASQRPSKFFPLKIAQQADVVRCYWENCGLKYFGAIQNQVAKINGLESDPAFALKELRNYILCIILRGHCFGQ